MSLSEPASLCKIILEGSISEFVFHVDSEYSGARVHHHLLHVAAFAKFSSFPEACTATWVLPDPGGKDFFRSDSRASKMKQSHPTHLGSCMARIWAPAWLKK